MEGQVECPICHKVISMKDPASFFQHVKANHSLSTKFFVTCKFPGCNDQYLKYDSFRRHWNKRHGASLQNPHEQLNIPKVLDGGTADSVNPCNDGGAVESASQEINEGTTEGHTSLAIQQHALNDIGVVGDMQDGTSPTTCVEQHSNSNGGDDASLSRALNVANKEQTQTTDFVVQPAGKEVVKKDQKSQPKPVWLPPPALVDKEWEAGVLLLLRQKHYLSFDALMLVSSTMHEFYEKRVVCIQKKLAAILSSTITGSQEFRDVFNSIQEEDGQTRSRIECTWKKVFPTVMPKEVKLNEDDPSYEWIKDPEAGLILDEVFETGYIIPFIESLQQFLSIKNVYDLVLESFKSNSCEPAQVYSDVWDGKYVKLDPLYIKLDGAILGFQIYMDEVELANPLGSKKGKHKVALFYWVLMNLPPRFRSSLRSIQLLGVVSCDLLKQRGVNKFLGSFLDDLLLLRKGVSLKIRSNESRNWFGMVLNFVGDIPASNFIGGFKEGVGFANLPCRSCMIHRDDLPKIHHESDCSLRDKVSHEQHVAEIENPEESQATRDSLSTKYGVNRKSCFALMDYFDPTKCFMHDLMHVSYEGSLNLGTALLLNYLISDPDIKLNLDDINYKISNLKCDREFPVPPAIRKNEVMELNKLSFSSSEMVSVAVCLGLVLGDYVSSDNPHYANYILLLEILASLQCYSFTEEQLVLLEFNIERHNSNHIVLYPNATITPKLHSLLHFPSQIRQFGPPRYSWCFRYESKNAPFKKIMRRNCNFHNVPWSLATHHQKLVAYDVRTDGEADYFGMADDIKVICLSDHNLPIFVKHSHWSELLLQSTNLLKESTFRTVKKIKVGGRICSVGSVFLQQLPKEDKSPLFYRIADILIANEDILFIMENLVTRYLCTDRFSFIVLPQKTFSVVKGNALPFNAPLYSFFYDYELHVIPNYYHIL